MRVIIDFEIIFTDSTTSFSHVEVANAIDAQDGLEIVNDLIPAIIRKSARGRIVTTINTAIASQEETQMAQTVSKFPAQFAQKAS